MAAQRGRGDPHRRISLSSRHFRSCLSLRLLVTYRLLVMLGDTVREQRIRKGLTGKTSVLIRITPTS